MAIVAPAAVAPAPPNPSAPSIPVINAGCVASAPPTATTPITGMPQHTARQHNAPVAIALVPRQQIVLQQINALIAKQQSSAMMMTAMMMKYQQSKTENGIQLNILQHEHRLAPQKLQQSVKHPIL